MGTRMSRMFDEDPELSPFDEVPKPAAPEPVTATRAKGQHRNRYVDAVASAYEAARADEHKVFTRKMLRWMALELVARMTQAERIARIRNGQWLVDVNAEADQ